MILHGSVAPNFFARVKGEVRTIAKQSDGMILIGGDFTSIVCSGQTYTINRIARLYPYGYLDTGFNPNAAGGIVNSLALQADGKIIAGGLFTSISGTTRNGIARLHPDGSLDATYDPGQ